MAKILIVDDEEAVRAVVSTVLTNAGFEDILEAQSGEEGLESFHQTNPDLVICDIVMPGIGGLETIRRMKEKDPGAKIMAISGWGGRALCSAKEVGADLAVPKPFRIGELLQVVKELLQKESGE